MTNIKHKDEELSLTVIIKCGLGELRNQAGFSLIVLLGFDNESTRMKDKNKRMR